TKRAVTGGGKEFSCWHIQTKKINIDDGSLDMAEKIQSSLEARAAGFEHVQAA
ncbi:hypothetical protein Tco_1460680, partial [Tanacetum coccineum]